MEGVDQVADVELPDQTGTVRSLLSDVDGTVATQFDVKSHADEALEVPSSR